MYVFRCESLRITRVSFPQLSTHRRCPLKKSTISEAGSWSNGSSRPAHDGLALHQEQLLDGKDNKSDRVKGLKVCPCPAGRAPIALVSAYASRNSQAQLTNKPLFPYWWNLCSRGNS